MVLVFEGKGLETHDIVVEVTDRDVQPPIKVHKHYSFDLVAKLVWTHSEQIGEASTFVRLIF